MGKEKGKYFSKDEPGKLQKVNLIRGIDRVVSQRIEVSPGLFLSGSEEGGGRRWVASTIRPRLTVLLGSIAGTLGQEGLPELTFEQAAAKAGRWRRSFFGRVKAGIPTDRTLGDALEVYRWARAQSQKGCPPALDRVIDRIARRSGWVPIRHVTQDFIEELLEHLSEPADRTKGGSEKRPEVQAVEGAPICPTAYRLRFLAQVLRVVKASLDLALANGWVASDREWRRVRLPEAPRIRRTSTKRPYEIYPLMGPTSPEVQ